MAENRQKLVHLHTSDVKIPTQGLLDLGEIAVQHNNAEPALYIEKTNGEVAKFIDATAVEAKVAVEKARAEGAEEDLANRINTLEVSSHTHDNKTVLDGITEEKVTAWDAAEANAKKDAADKYQVKGEYEAAGAAAQALKDAKDYTDSKVDGKFDDKGDAAKALSDAKTYADGLNTAMDSRVDTLEVSSHTHDNKTVLDGITAVKVAAWDAAEANAISSAKTYTDATIEALNLANTYEAKGTAQNLINGLKLAETYASKNVESTISTLVGEDTGKSVRSVSAEEVAKIVNGADTRYDTLKEIADWIISDTTGSAQMANDINALKAISADTRLETLESSSHSHSNKDLLDTYTQTESNLADAVAKKHEHTNKTVLDGITDVKVAAWDDAEANAISSSKTYTDSVASGKADAVHTHAIANVTGLQDALNGKAASTHTHAIDDVTGLQDALDGKDSQGAAAQALIDAKAYTDEKLIKIDCGTY